MQNENVAGDDGTGNEHFHLLFRDYEQSHDTRRRQHCRRAKRSHRAFGYLKKQVEEQYLATLALQELLNRQLPVLKKEAAEEAKKTKPKQSNPTIKNNTQPKFTPSEIKLLEQEFNLF